MTPASFVTLFRLFLIPFFLMAVTYGHCRVALWLFLLAGVSDLLDGLIARYWAQQSLMGSILDPMADKLIMTTAYIALALKGVGLPHPIPAWLPVLTISRDVFIVVISLLLNISMDVKRFPPSMLGKVTTFVQISFAVAALIQNAYGFNETFMAFLLWLVTGLTVISGLHYLWRTREWARISARPPEKS